jgi:hypothetical protein
MEYVHYFLNCSVQDRSGPTEIVHVSNGPPITCPFCIKDLLTGYYYTGFVPTKLPLPYLKSQLKLIERTEQFEKDLEDLINA